LKFYDYPEVPKVVSHALKLDIDSINVREQ
jgi:hypothetical protein